MSRVSSQGRQQKGQRPPCRMNGMGKGRKKEREERRKEKVEERRKEKKEGKRRLVVHIQTYGHSSLIHTDRTVRRLCWDCVVSLPFTLIGLCSGRAVTRGCLPIYPLPSH
uniref:Uncharacterized protein n=1 Tax=Timema poppense TaxID=170557 RepID=A0A7R9DVZ2_TIMPO|nr:unnamed protein product [Timema poppensis]